MNIAISLFWLFMIAGCAGVKYTNVTGEKFSYYRFGTQRIDGFALSKDAQGIVTVSFTKQEGTEGSLVEALKNISEVAAKITTKVP